MESSLTSARILQIASQYSFFISCITFSAGIVGNALNIFIFTHLKFFRSNRCVFYLTIESISDIVYELFSIIVTILTSLYGNNITTYSPVACRLSYIVTQSCSLITCSMICFAASDQFFSTNYRLNLRQMCTLKLARYLVSVITVIWLTHSIFFSFFVNVLPSVGCTIVNPNLIRYATYFLYPVLGGLLPIVTASLFSLLAFRNVRRIVRRQIPIERRRFDRQITAMVLLRVVVFVFLTLPYIIFRIFIINVTITPATPLLFAVIQLVQAILSSSINFNHLANFYIFIAISSRYRRQVKYVLVKKCWQKWKYWCCIKRNEVRPENPISINSNNEIK